MDSLFEGVNVPTSTESVSSSWQRREAHGSRRKGGGSQWKCAQHNNKADLGIAGRGVRGDVENWNVQAAKMNRPLWVFLNSQVKLFRLEKMWDSNHKKLIVKIEGDLRTDPKVEDLSPREMWEYYLLPKLMAGGPGNTTKELIDIAPAGELERVLQALGQREVSSSGGVHDTPGNQHRSVVYVSKSVEQSLTVTVQEAEIGVATAGAHGIDRRVDAYMNSIGGASIEALRTFCRSYGCSSSGTRAQMLQSIRESLFLKFSNESS